MLHRFAALCSALILTACVGMTNVPEAHKGPVAVIRDSAVTQSSNKADMFFLYMIDGQRIRDSSMATRQGNEGRGFSLTTTVIERQVLPQESVFRVMGRTQYGAPIQAMLGTVYEVSGDVKFTPEPNKRYVVRGELGAAYSAVWIEEEGSRSLVGEKVESRGTAKQ
jgi:hypothetical protein